jgi:hypothetical protein
VSAADGEAFDPRDVVAVGRAAKQERQQLLAEALLAVPETKTAVDAADLDRLADAVADRLIEKLGLQP